jgi:hypothetical protein
MATNAAKAAGRISVAVATQSPVNANPETMAARLEACGLCPECIMFEKPGKTYHRCAKCGCWLDGKFFAKASLATETCPLGKWGAS